LQTIAEKTVENFRGLLFCCTLYTCTIYQVNGHFRINPLPLHFCSPFRRRRFWIRPLRGSSSSWRHFEPARAGPN